MNDELAVDQEMPDEQEHGVVQDSPVVQEQPAEQEQVVEQEQVNAADLAAETSTEQIQETPPEAPRNNRTNEASDQWWSPFILIAVLFAVMYIMLIRPQKRREQQRREMLSRLQSNDKVVTIGGIIGVVESLSDKEAVILLEDKTKMRVTRSAISRIISEELPE